MPARKWIHRKRNSQPSVPVSAIVALLGRTADQSLHLALVLIPLIVVFIILVVIQVVVEVVVVLEIVILVDVIVLLRVLVLFFFLSYQRPVLVLDPRAISEAYHVKLLQK